MDPEVRSSVATAPPAPGGSWLDAALAAVDRAPLAPWSGLLALAVLLFAVGVLLDVAAGVTTGPRATLSLIVGVSMPVAYFGGLAWLNDVAARAMATIRPALRADDAVAATVARDLLRTPVPLANAAIVASLLLVLISILSAPQSFGLAAADPPALWIREFLLAFLGSLAAAALVVHAAHQLRVVRRVHRDLVVVDLYRLQPLYAFANLTAWTGIVLVAATIYGIVALQFVSPAGPAALSELSLAAMFVLLGSAAACFVVPLHGLHRRIAEAKDAELERATASLRLAIEQVHERLAGPEERDLTQAKSGIEAATAAVAAIGSISTWPWRPGTLRAFLSALGLPVAIWLIQALLARVLSV